MRWRGPVPRSRLSSSAASTRRVERSCDSRSWLHLGECRDLMVTSWCTGPGSLAAHPQPEPGLPLEVGLQKKATSDAAGQTDLRKAALRRCDSTVGWSPFPSLTPSRIALPAERPVPLVCSVLRTEHPYPRSLAWAGHPSKAREVPSCPQLPSPLIRPIWGWNSRKGPPASYFLESQRRLPAPAHHTHHTRLPAPELLPWKSLFLPSSALGCFPFRPSPSPPPSSRSPHLFEGECGHC